MKSKSAFSIKKIMQKRSANFRMDSTQTSFTGQSVFKELTFQGRIPRSVLNKEVRKTYPLRGQFSSAMNDKTCTVVLTRLEDVAGPRVIDGQIGSPPSISCWVDDFGTLKVHTGLPSKRQRICSKREKIPVVSNEVDPIHNFPEPRQRRLASLNAEAVNNLLFARDAIFSARRVRKDFTKVSGNFNSGEAWQTLKNQEQQVLSKKARQKCIPTNHLQKDVFDNNVKRDDCGVSFPPAPKRLASLNAVAFLKLTNEKANHLKQRSKSDGDSRPANSFSKSKLKSAKSHKKNCIKSQKDVLHSKVDDQRDRPREAEGGFLKPEHQDSSRSLGKIDNPNVEQSSNYQDGLDSLYNRLPLLMGGQASMKPEYGRPGEKSPTPKQEFQQPSFPVQQLHHLPVPGSPLDCVGLYNSHNLTLDGNYVSYGQSGLPYNGYPDLSMYTKDGVFSQPVIYEELLISKSSLPSTTTLEHLPWCNSRYSLVEDAGTNTDSLCGVIRLPIGRVNNMHTGHNSYPYKKPFTAEGYKTLDQLNIEIATAGHPVSPAHPLSGCPVPSVPPAAEPVPYLQTPNSEPQTLAMVKTARECPQSSKPPSGSKSGVRNTPGCIHVTDNKASKGHSHPKQQRISRRRATNGWMPLGIACEKAVYVVNEPEPALRRSYQAVERNGEIIRVRDTVLLKSGPRKKSMPYVAKISALWEEPITGELMMSLFWYYRPEHTQGGRNPSMHQNEIFASRHQDENSIACIEEKCYVLTFAEYCRFCALVKRRGEGCPNRKALIVPPSEEYCTPIHRRVPDTTDPDLVFLCRHVYDFRHGRILKNPQ